MNKYHINVNIRKDNKGGVGEKEGNQTLFKKRIVGEDFCVLLLTDLDVL